VPSNIVNSCAGSAANTRTQSTPSANQTAGVQGSTAQGFEDDEAKTRARLDIMNLTVNIDKRIRSLFERTEHEILSAVCSQNMQISPYSPVYVPPTQKGECTRVPSTGHRCGPVTDLCLV
jgi:hypothetical protein